VIIESTLHNPVQAKPLVDAAWLAIKGRLMADPGCKLVLSVKLAPRSSAQNRKMWAMLAEVSAQVVWHGQKLAAEDWKHIFTAALKKQRAVPGIDGGFVVLGTPTKTMSRVEVSDLIEVMSAFGAEQGVKFKAWIDPETGEVF
jgi:NinB protein